MSRYIDADKLKAHYSWWKIGSDEFRKFKKTFDEIIDCQPSVNLRETAYWEPRIEMEPGNFSSTHWYCSLCGKEAWLCGDFDFCPHCGATIINPHRKENKGD